MTHKLSHFDEEGASRMVDVGPKDITRRMARASATVRMSSETAATIRDRQVAKGDVIETARLAGIMAAKCTGSLIPLCHPLVLDAVSVDITFADERTVRIQSEVRATQRTGVEMEALTAVSVAALTLYDMCKSLDRNMIIQSIRLDEKSGGRSGHFRREQTDNNNRDT